MSLSPTIERFLDNKHIPYKRVFHPYAETAMGCAIAAKVPPKRVAKGVVLRDDEGFVMAVVPADRQVDLRAVNHFTNRLLTTAEQKDVSILFRDCARGAVPSLGQTYNLPVIWDDHLGQEPECYLEAGDHRELVKMNRDSFLDSMQNQPHGRISF